MLGARLVVESGPAPSAKAKGTVLCQLQEQDHGTRDWVVCGAVEAVSVDDAQVKAEVLYPEFELATVPLRCD